MLHNLALGTVLGMSLYLMCYKSSHDFTHLALRAAPPAKGTLCYLLRCMQVGAPGAELALRKLDAGVCHLLHDKDSYTNFCLPWAMKRCEDAQEATDREVKGQESANQAKAWCQIKSQ